MQVKPHTHLAAHYFEMSTLTAMICIVIGSNAINQENDADTVIPIMAVANLVVLVLLLVSLYAGEAPFLMRFVAAVNNCCYKLVCADMHFGLSARARAGGGYSREEIAKCCSFARPLMFYAEGEWRLLNGAPRPLNGEPRP